MYSSNNSLPNADETGNIDTLAVVKLKKELQKTQRFKIMGKTADKIELMDDAPTKSVYSQEDNYRAFKLFSMMDSDNGGSISLREVNRVMMGDSVRYVTMNFEHPDTGVVWALDEDNCVIIASVEPYSLGAAEPILVENMRLVRINNSEIPLHDPRALSLLYRKLVQCDTSPIELEFLEPILILNQYNYMLDIEVEKRIFSIKLPLGAVYNLDVFRTKMNQAFTAAHQALQWITIDFLARKRQIIFECDRYSFKLLFKSGPYRNFSCKYVLGFGDQDTPVRGKHRGRPLVIDINLGLNENNMEILMTELFIKFDADGSGEFEFEEFRDFYMKYLDTDESLARLRNYANYRFRDIEFEELVAIRQQDSKAKVEKRGFNKEKYKHSVALQKQKQKEDSQKDIYGITRRNYRHRTNATIKMANKYAPQKLQLGGEIGGIGSPTESVRLLPNLDEEPPLKSKIKLGKKALEALRIAEEEASLASQQTFEKKQEEAYDRHVERKRKSQETAVRQTKRRKAILKKIFEANSELNQVHMYTVDHVYTYTHILIHIHILILVYIHTYSYTCTYTHTHTHVHTHILIHMYIHTYSYICTYIHTHTHTHIPA